MRNTKKPEKYTRKFHTLCAMTFTPEFKYSSDSTDLICRFYHDIVYFILFFKYQTDLKIKLTRTVANLPGRMHYITFLMFTVVTGSHWL